MIIYCCADLIFATKVRSTAEQLGVVTRPVRDISMLQKRIDQVEDGKANGPVAAMLIDLDTGEQGIELIRYLKTAEPAIPIVAFGAHVATELLQAAGDAGADEVMPRGQFTASLPSLLQNYSEK